MLATLAERWLCATGQRGGPIRTMLSSEGEEAFRPEGKYLFYNLIKRNILLHISLDKVVNKYGGIFTSKLDVLL